MTEQSNSNAQSVHDWGIKAAELLNSGLKTSAKAEGLAIYALFNAQNIIFSCEVGDKKDSFTLLEYINKSGTNKEDGTRNLKLLAARTNQIALMVFGAADPNPALKQLMIRACNVVSYFIEHEYTNDQIKLSKANNLIVPYHLMYFAPSANASENDIISYEKLKDSDLVLDGTKGKSFAELARKVKPAVVNERAAHSNTKDKDVTKEFKQATTTMYKSLKNLLIEDPKDDIPAITETMHGDLYSLYIQLGKYFAADPVQTKETFNKAG